MTIPQSHLFLSSFIHTVHLTTSCRCPRSNYSKPVPILMHFVPPALFHSFNTSLVKLFPSLLYSKFRLLIPEAAPFIFVGRRRTILQATSAGAISGDQSTIILHITALRQSNCYGMLLTRTFALSCSTVA